MSAKFIENKVFQQNDITVSPLEKGEYEHCTFNHCDLSNLNLSEFKFINCTFTGCNFTLTVLNKTSFTETTFKECKLLGARFDLCNPFTLSFRFENCQMNLSSFFRVKMKNTKFIHCSLQEVDFTECDLTGALFDQCDLGRAIFDGTTLEKADLRSAYNYSIDPANNKIKKAKFSLQGVAGLLDKFDIEIEGR